MATKFNKNQRILEIFLVVIVLALACLLSRTVGYKMIVLNLFFLPVVLAGFFLGRYRAGVLALFSVITASLITSFDLTSFAAFNKPIVIALAMLLWGAVLGLTALLVGTLSDERVAKIDELHEAYVGVVEVLSRYLQSANPTLEAESNRVAQLSQQVASQLKLSPKEVDDIRVAALLHDMENIEITSRVFRKAVGNLQSGEENALQHTFNGTDLVQSLGSVLSGALPLVVEQGECIQDSSLSEEGFRSVQISRGAQIIQATRAFVALTEGDWGQPGADLNEAIEELRGDTHADYDPHILEALEKVAAVTSDETQREPEPVA